MQAATSDGTAVAGQDYFAKNKTVAFAAGVTSQTAQVLDDAHDEGSETMMLMLSHPSGAHISDGEAMGPSSYSDSLPRALLP